MGDLKPAPCPFCGSEAEVSHSYREDDHRYPRDFWHVKVACTGCWVEQSWSRYGEQEARAVPATVKANAEAEAIAAWNRRSTPHTGGEAEAKPVAWRTRGPNGGWMHSDSPPSFWTNMEPLYLHPPRQPQGGR